MRVSWSPFSSCQIHLLEIVLKHQACICGARSTPAKKARSWPQRRAGYFPQCPAAWNYTIEVNSPHKELCKLNQRHWTSPQKELFLFIFFVVFFFFPWFCWRHTFTKTVRRKLCLHLYFSFTRKRNINLYKVKPSKTSVNNAQPTLHTHTQKKALESWPQPKKNIYFSYWYWAPSLLSEVADPASRLKEH